MERLTVAAEPPIVRDQVRALLPGAIKAIRYKPGFSFRMIKQDETTCWVEIQARLPDSDPENAPDYQRTTEVVDTVPVRLNQVRDVTDVYRALIGFVIEREIHEATEFFRVGPDLHAPFHPHHRPRVDWQAQDFGAHTGATS